MMTPFDSELTRQVTSRIRDVPDFPKPGIVFKDLTPVLADGAIFSAMMRAFAARYRSMSPTTIVAIEARGFVVGAPIAAELGVGITLLRKPGKLPWNTVRQAYDLEYGTDALEMHEDAIAPGTRAIIVDDLLATGGTMRAAIDLIRARGAQVLETGFIVELGFLGGRSRLDGVPAASVVRF